jgi:flagellar hook-basal body complex protein FliE
MNIRNIEIPVPNMTHRTQYGQSAFDAKQDVNAAAPFSDYFNRAVAGVAGSDLVDKATNIGLMTGTLDNLHTATIAAEKAEIMLNLTVQVRNRMVEAYQEVMRMPM